MIFCFGVILFIQLYQCIIIKIYRDKMHKCFLNPNTSDKQANNYIKISNFVDKIPEINREHSFSSI